MNNNNNDLNNNIGRGILWVFASYSQSTRYIYYINFPLVIIIVGMRLTYLNYSSLNIKFVSRSSNAVIYTSKVQTPQDHSKNQTVAVVLSHLPTPTIIIDLSSILHTYSKVGRGDCLTI